MIRISGSEWLGRVVFLGAPCVDDVSAIASVMTLAVVRYSWSDAIASAVAGREADANP